MIEFTDEQKERLHALWQMEAVNQGTLGAHTRAAYRFASEIAAQMVAAERERLMELVEDLREEMVDSRHTINSNRGFFDGVKLSLRVIDKLFSAEFERREAERQGA